MTETVLTITLQEIIKIGGPMAILIVFLGFALFVMYKFLLSTIDKNEKRMDSIHNLHMQERGEMERMNISEREKKDKEYMVLIAKRDEEYMEWGRSIKTTLEECIKTMTKVATLTESKRR